MIAPSEAVLRADVVRPWDYWLEEPSPSPECIDLTKEVKSRQQSLLELSSDSPGPSWSTPKSAWPVFLQIQASTIGRNAQEARAEANRRSANESSEEEETHSTVSDEIRCFVQSSGSFRIIALCPLSLLYWVSVIVGQSWDCLSWGHTTRRPYWPFVVLLVIVSSLKSEYKVFYLDDGTIGGTLEDISVDLAYIEKEGRQLGLRLNVAKSELICNDYSHAQAVCQLWPSSVTGISFRNYIFKESYELPN